MAAPTFLTSPPPRYPAWLEYLLEQWARVHPKLKLLITLAVVGAIALAQLSSLSKVAPSEMREVWVATDTVWPAQFANAKTALDLNDDESSGLPPPPDTWMEARQYPVDLIPPGALTAAPKEHPIIPVVAGTVLMEEHFTTPALATKLPAGHTMLAVPTADASLFVPGMHADVWDVSVDPPRPLTSHVEVMGLSRGKVLIGVATKQAGEFSALMLKDALAVTASSG